MVEVSFLATLVVAAQTVLLTFLATTTTAMWLLFEVYVHVKTNLQEPHGNEGEKQ